MEPFDSGRKYMERGEENVVDEDSAALLSDVGVSAAVSAAAVSAAAVGC